MKQGIAGSLKKPAGPNRRMKMKMTHEMHEANRVRNMAREQAKIIEAAHRAPEQIVSVEISDEVVKEICVPLGDGLFTRTGLVWKRTYVTGRLCDILAAGHEYHPSIHLRGRLNRENCADLVAMGDPSRLKFETCKYQTGTK